MCLNEPLDGIKTTVDTMAMREQQQAKREGRLMLQFRHRITFIALIYCCVLALFSGCNPISSPVPIPPPVPVSPATQSDFFDAILANNCFEAAKLVEVGADINALSTDNHTIKVRGLNAFVASGQTALHMAAFYGKTEAVEWLLEEGANVNALDSEGNPPILDAMMGGLLIYDRLDIATLLIENGADINAQDEGGWTPLLDAAWGCKTDFTRMLLEKGANINAKTSKGWSALYLAARGCQIDTVKLLLEKGADVNAKDIDGNTPLRIAKQKGKSDIVAILQANGGRE
jgi:ankyrin repeat protein